MLNTALDIFFLVFLFWFALVGLRQGFIGMLGRLLSAFAALILAFLFSGPLIDLLNSRHWFSGFQETLGSTIFRLFDGSAPTAPQAIEASSLPAAWQQGLLNRLPATAGQANDITVNGAASPLALLANELAGRILTALVFFVLFIIILFVIRLVLQLISNVVNKLPVIGALNRVAGLFAGVAYGLMLVLIALLVVTLAVPWLPEAARTVSETTLLSFFYNNNPLLLVF